MNKKYLSHTFLFIAISPWASANSNQDSMAQAMASLCGNTGALSSELVTECSAPDRTSSSYISAVTPEEYLAMTQELKQVGSSILRQLATAREQSRRSQEAIFYRENPPNSQQVSVLSGYFGGNAGGADSSPSLQLFFSSGKDDAHHSATDLSTDYDSDNIHSLAGFEIQITAPWLIGAAFGVSDTEATFESDYDSTDSDSQHLILFSSWYRDQFAVDSVLAYSDGTLTTRRSLPDANARGEADHELWLFHLNGQFDFTHDAWSYGPMASLEVQSGTIDAYTETGTSVWNLSIPEQEYHSFIYSVGAQFSYQKSLSWAVLIPYGSLERRKEFRDREQGFTGYFNSVPQQAFNSSRDGFDNYWFRSALGLIAVFQHGISAYIDFTRLDGYTATDFSSLSLGLRAEF